MGTAFSPGRLRRDPGLGLLLVALVAAVALYAPTLGRGLSNYDDPWLYEDNALVRQPSKIGVVLTDLTLPNRFTLGAEYLPVRDLSVMADYQVWGERYGGFHATNLAIYLVAIALWFAAFCALGVPRVVAGLAMVIWAVHPSHAESVAWLAERKGLLGVMWAGACVWGYARYRASSRWRYLALAVVGGVAAVWSKAIAAFAVAAIAGIEIVVRRTAGLSGSSGSSGLSGSSDSSGSSGSRSSEADRTVTGNGDGDGDGASRGMRTAGSSGLSGLSGLSGSSGLSSEAERTVTGNGDGDGDGASRGMRTAGSSGLSGSGSSGSSDSSGSSSEAERTVTGNGDGDGDGASRGMRTAGSSGLSGSSDSSGSSGSSGSSSSSGSLGSSGLLGSSGSSSEAERTVTGNGDGDGDGASRAVRTAGSSGSSGLTGTSGTSGTSGSSGSSRTVTGNGDGDGASRGMRAVIVVGIAAALAYVPVVLVATRFGVVGTGSAISRPIAVLGVHGFDLRVALGLVSNSVSYAIAATGPGALDMILGGVGFVLCASVFVPRWSTRVWALPLRIAVVLWLFGWLPVGHLILPIQQVFVADRYLLIPTLGAALALATGITRLRGKTLVGCALVIAFAIRALDAQSSWASNVALWQRAVTSSPTDGNAWSMLVEALDADGRTAEASDAVETAFTHTRAPRLVMHAGLTALAEHRTDQAFAFMTEAAVGGEPRAMANLANMLAGTNHLQPALLWARLAVAIAPGYANGHRIHGKIARLIDQHSVESLDAFARAYVIEPDNAMNRYNYGIALVDAGRRDEGKTLLESCVDDPQVGRYARVALQHV